MSGVIETLLRNGPVVTDGAWGTQLQQRGLPIGACPDEWNVSHPDRVLEVPSAYVTAGAQVVLTNTFGGNRLVLAGQGCEDRAEAINRAGVEISKKAAGDKAKVFASIGPCGKLPSMGDIDEEELLDIFRAQARALAAGGADALVVETMSDLDELRIAVTAAKETGLEVVGCMSYDAGKDCDRTMMGVTPEQSVEVLEGAGADAVGGNCGQGAEGYVAIAGRLRAATKLPVWIKANAGLPVMKDGKAVYETTPEAFAEAAAKLVDAGADFVGGCCGTGPDFIAALCKAVK